MPNPYDIDAAYPPQATHLTGDDLAPLELAGESNRHYAAAWKVWLTQRVNRPLVVFLVCLPAASAPWAFTHTSLVRVGVLLLSAGVWWHGGGGGGGS
jgi:hypothetical protein